MVKKTINSFCKSDEAPSLPTVFPSIAFLIERKGNKQFEARTAAPNLLLLIFT
jgi:hypothetical protein